jgi:hypothetical protein
LENLTVWGEGCQDRRMPSLIERASSGRAKCRACGQTIAKGEERFGEALPNSYGEGESLFWFHLRCAACSRPESFLAFVEQGDGAPVGGELIALARGGVAQPRLSRILKAERASSGRARCRHCRELIEQGGWRIALQMFEDGRFNSMGTIHASCAVHYFGEEPSLERLTLPSNQLSAEELEGVLATVREGAARTIPAQTTAAQTTTAQTTTAQTNQPGLAKTTGEGSGGETGDESERGEETRELDRGEEPARGPKRRSS